MTTSELPSLNERFACPPELTFKDGSGGLPIAVIANRYAQASVALHGGQVLAFQPRGHTAVLWVSSRSHFAAGKAIRGGIPICWPWFGPHPADPGKPAHGFARLLSWSVLGSEVTAEHETRLRLGLSDRDSTRALWPQAFELELNVTVGQSLDVELVIRNPGSAPFTCTGALHSYFAVSDIANVRIHGLHGCAYLDKLANDERFEQAGAIAVGAETDRVYLDTVGDYLIVDDGWQRTLRVAKRGSHTTVIWNPWVDRARQLADFADEEYREMVCVETANTADDRITVEPGREHRLATRLGLETI